MISSSTDDTADAGCANCCKGEAAGIKLKSCTACKMVRYCCRDCQVEHWPRHKKACKKRMAKFEEQLLKDHPERPDCPICMLTLPPELHQVVYRICCGQTLCLGCMYAQEEEDAKSGKRWDEIGTCAFCRAPTPKTVEETNILTNTLFERNNAHAVNDVADNYARYEKGHGTLAESWQTRIFRSISQNWQCLPKRRNCSER